MENNRRTFIRTIGVGSLAGLAGCSSLTGDETTDENPGGNGGDGPKIITIDGAGTDIWNTADAGHWFYTQVSGDFDVRVHCTSIENTNPHAKGGIMARASTEPRAKNVMIRRRPGYATSPQWRPENGSSTTSTTSEDGQPLSRVDGGMFDGNWQRLERSGDTIRAYGSEDGEEWTLVAEIPSNVMSLPDEVSLGLAVTSHDQANAATAKFRGLEGLDTADMTSEDLGNPIIKGSVTVSQPAVVNLTEPDTSPTAASLTGELETMGGADAVDVSFEYREAMSDEWQSTDVTTLEETGEFGFDVSGLTPRRYYQYRAHSDNGEAEISTVNQLFSTPSNSSGSSEEGPRSASQIDPGDGFADVAPWLDDDTPLVVVSEPTREELARATNIAGPRVVVFETSGTIDLGAEDLNVRNDNCWIAGQTAPSPGITLIRGGLWVYGNNSVVQHIRVRPGDAGQDEGWQPDAIEMADDTEGNVIDHCTGTWGVDENINVGYDTNDSTISNCLIAEPLNDATHEKGEHGYNSIVGNNAKNVAHVGNVMALGTDRNPRLKQGTETVVVNDYVHYYGDGMWADPDTSHAIVGNVFEDPQSDEANVFGDGSVYAEDNLQAGDGSVDMIGSNITMLDSEPHWPETLEALDSSAVIEHNLANVGARPADRTEDDERIISAISSGDGGVIDSQEDVNGYPELAENTEDLGEPESNLRAWLREEALAVEE
ncbi:pectate lyase [Natrinema sp. DC36]|uniref:pectate lyase n=1 Tax=Natrinema sp. DC36 TaxID=2878680 RepID=UPI001CEFF5D8|nr:pectate lyase [Natrinema sp. DC36]